jgi:transposase-like protein
MKLLVYNQSLVPGSSVSLVSLKFSTVYSETARPWMRPVLEDGSIHGYGVIV